MSMSQIHKQTNRQTNRQTGRQTGRQARRVQGFTLIELIAVLVILGILAVVAIPQYNDMRVAATQGAMRGIATSAMSQLSIDYGAMSVDGTPPSATDLATEVDGKVAISGGNYTIAYAGDNGANTVTITVSNVDDNTITIPDVVFTLP